MFKSKLPTVSQQKDDLRRASLETEISAKMWLHTKMRHEQHLADYKERINLKYHALAQVYDMTTDPNVIYWQDQIDFCEYEINLLRSKWERIRELLKAGE